MHPGTPDSVWAKMSGGRAQSLKASTQTPGPFAFLVRDFALQEDGRNFFHIPEFVEDWADSAQSFGIDLCSGFLSSTVPTMVKFAASQGIHDGVMESAVYYLAKSHHGYDVCHESNTCFEGDGSVIPNSDILAVEAVSMIE